MKNSVLGKPAQRANLSKSGFNMSQNLKFTSSCGHLLPVYYDILNPGESVKVSFDLFTRTQPLQTAAMVDIDEYVDLFFVPLSKVNHRMFEILEHIQDKSSDLFENDIDYFPLIDFTAFDPEDFSQYGVYGSRYDGMTFGILRLLDMLNISPDILGVNVEDNSLNEDYQPQLSLLIPACYQAIYYDYYRLSDWENNDIEAYNFDSYQNNDESVTGAGRFEKLFQLRYRAYQRDYFKAIQPSPLISSIGLYGNNATYLANFDSWLFMGSPVVSRKDGSGSVNPANPYAQTQLPSSYIPSAQSIRAAFAVDKLLRVTGLAGKHYDAQVLAHFGFEVPKQYSNEVVHIGGHHQVIHVGEVISTAETSEASLGKIAGKGYSKGESEDMRYTAPCHGVLMAIYSCVPRLDYVGGIDKIHTMSDRLGFYTPELDNLGMTPLFAYEMEAADQFATNRFGWQYPFMHLKCKYDRATRAFCSDVYNDPDVVGTFRHWAIAYHGNLGNSSYGLSNLLCSPSDLDSIMLASYVRDVDLQDYANYGASILYQRDPLIHSLRVSAFKTSTMSTFGLEKDI